MISAIIMASGFGRRMGKEKLLLDIDGLPIIERVISSVKNSYVDEIILIYRKKEIKDIGTKYNIKTIYNPNSELGQSASINLGINNCSSNSKGYMFFVGDQPFINSNTINKVIDAFKEGKGKIVIPYYNGLKGNPIIFSNYFKDNLLNIVGDKGGSEVIKENLKEVYKIHIENEIIGYDIDNEEDYKRVLKGR